MNDILDLIPILFCTAIVSIFMAGLIGLVRVKK